MLKKLHLHETHQIAGATFVERCGWEIPAKFSSVEAEYEALSEGAGLLDLSNSGIIELRGDDRTRFLHGMVTNDIKALESGKGCYAAFLTPQGRMVADLRVFCLANSLLVTVEPSRREALPTGLRKYIIGDRPQLVELSDELAILSLQGPKASQAASSIFECVAPTEPFNHLEVSLSGISLRICRVNRTGAGGYDLILPQKNLSGVWSLLLEKGKSFGLQPAGFESHNIHRIEAGIPWSGLDIDENTLPIEAGLERNAISFTKGCYIGQESVARITYRGQVNRKFSGLVLAGKHPASPGDKVLNGEQEVGWITSSVYSLALQKPIALGYLRREVLEPGTPLVIQDDRGAIPTKVEALPFTNISKTGRVSKQ